MSVCSITPLDVTVFSANHYVHACDDLYQLHVVRSLAGGRVRGAGGIASIAVQPFKCVRALVFPSC